MTCRPALVARKFRIWILRDHLHEIELIDEGNLVRTLLFRRDDSAAAGGRGRLRLA
jgi:hypothetical protein